MGALMLPGCRTTPLGGYLAALGLLSAVTRLLDGRAAGSWRRQTFVLSSRCTSVEELAADLCARFEPEPIISPWNQGSGFAGNGKSVAAERALSWVRDGDDPRLACLRAAVAAADRVVAAGRGRGWGGKKDELWDAARKGEVLRLCRNEFPDRAVRWLDAAVALGADGDVSFARLLGTGGNLGRLDLSSTYLQLTRLVLEHLDSRAWLASLLDGRSRVGMPRFSFGQYDPASAGNPEEAGELGNPWMFVLLVEGALLFATAVVRRHGAEYARAALPFQVHATSAGLGSAAPGENAMAELWAPEWPVPCTLAEVEQLLGEGRAQWHERPARSGLDFARAVATLGVDRGIGAFQRHMFAERLGQSPLAVPAGRVVVTRRGGVALLGGLDRWLDRVRRIGVAGLAAGHRAVEQALYTHARTGDAADLVEVFAAVGRCHELTARSGAARQVAGPLVLPGGDALLTELLPTVKEDADLRLALGLACAHDPGRVATMGGLRPLLSPVAVTHGRVAWVERAAPATVAGGLFGALAEAARVRGFPGATTTTVVDDDPPAVRGVRLGFQRGPAFAAADLSLPARGPVDERRTADLLAGLPSVDWSAVRLHHLPASGESTPDPAVDLLLPFTCTGRCEFAGSDGATIRTTLLPDASWPGLLRAGRVDRVLADAARRIRISGLRHVITPTGSATDGTRLASLLLARTTTTTRRAALARVAVLPDVPSKPLEITT